MIKGKKEIIHLFFEMAAISVMKINRVNGQGNRAF